jgi:hypothetical protein
MRHPVTETLALATLLIFSLPLQAAPPTERLPEGFPLQRGRYVFVNAQTLADPGAKPQDIAWLSRFDVVITNNWGLASPATLKLLHDRGSKQFLYFWTNGIYHSDLDKTYQDGTWRGDLYRAHPDWMVSPETLPAPDNRLPAYYFDLANPALVEYLCTMLAGYRARTGYDGIFFDYAGQWALTEEAQAAWKSRHPELPYDRALIAFYRRLREVDPGMLIATNQAYRSQEPLNAEVDYDVTESIATAVAWGPETEVDGKKLLETWYRPWGAYGLEAVSAEIAKSLLRTPPRGAFFYTDYMQPAYTRDATGGLVRGVDFEAVYYSYCAAALWGRAAWCSGWHAPSEYRGPLPFLDLGKPLSAYEVHNGIVLREYERGLVALLTDTKQAETSYELKQPSGRLYDLHASRTVPLHDGVATIRLKPGRYGLSGGLHPVGRVYLKTAK